MHLRPFLDADLLLDQRTPAEIAERRRQIRATMVAKASEAHLPPAERRQVIDLRDCARALADSGMVQRTATWSPWERLAFVSGWLAVATVLFGLLLLALELIAPWGAG